MFTFTPELMRSMVLATVFNRLEQWILIFALTAIVLLAIKPIQASDVKSLRLFYDLPSKDEHSKDEHSKNEPSVNSVDKSAQPTKKPLPSSSSSLNAKKQTYQYNGFINTAVGQHYYINGHRLAHSDVLQLVAVRSGGRELKIKTRGGLIFEIGIGQTVLLAYSDTNR